jgi:uncharacterized protein DUF4190
MSGLAPGVSAAGGYCQTCGRVGPTQPVTFRQNIGALIMRFYKTIEGQLCAECVRKYFWEMTGITLVGGWWGIVSFFFTPFILITNVVAYVSALSAFRETPVNAGAYSPAPVRPRVMGTGAPAAEPPPFRPPRPGMPSAAPPSRDLAIVSLGLGIFSLLCGTITLGIAPIGGIVTGIIALVRARNEPDRYGGRGLAIAGIAISAAALLFIVVGVILVVIAPDPARPR